MLVFRFTYTQKQWFLEQIVDKTNRNNCLVIIILSKLFVYKIAHILICAQADLMFEVFKSLTNIFQLIH